MTTFTTLSEESARPDVDGFFVPAFRVTVGDEVIRDMTSLSYKDSLTELDGFTFAVSNWHDSANEHRYIGSEPRDYEKHSRSKEFLVLEPSSREVSVEIGYGNHLTLMMSGTITSMSPKFSGGSSGSLTVSGVNTLYRLRNEQHTRTWVDATDSKIAESLGHAPGSSQKDRKDKPLEVRVAKKTSEKPRPYVAQRNQYDIDFLLRLARRNGYEIVAFEVQGKRATDPTISYLYFGPSDQFDDSTVDLGTRHIAGHSPAVRDVTYWLRWGESLIDVSPTLTTANQIGFVEVRGWDRKAKKPISVKVDVHDPRVKANKDLLPIMDRIGQKGEIVVDEPVSSVGEAEERALAILNDQRKQMVTIQASTVGLPDLRAGRSVRIGGIGARLSGIYFITESEHTMSSSGYTTRFSARREENEPA